MSCVSSPNPFCPQLNKISCSQSGLKPQTISGCRPSLCWPRPEERVLGNRDKNTFDCCWHLPAQSIQSLVLPSFLPGSSHASCPVWIGREKIWNRWKYPPPNLVIPPLRCVIHWPLNFSPLPPSPGLACCWETRPQLQLTQLQNFNVQHLFNKPVSRFRDRNVSIVGHFWYYWCKQSTPWCKILP